MYSDKAVDFEMGSMSLEVHHLQVPAIMCQSKLLVIMRQNIFQILQTL